VRILIEAWKGEEGAEQRSCSRKESSLKEGGRSLSRRRKEKERSGEGRKTETKKKKDYLFQKKEKGGVARTKGPASHGKKKASDVAEGER